MLGVGTIIGSMAWIIHGPMIARAGTAAALTAWATAGILTIPLALILMELSSMFPSAGGPYVYKYYALKRLVPGAGELIGFMTGWLFWAAITVGLACMGNGMANMLSACFWPNSTSPIWFGPAAIVALYGSAMSLNFMPVSRASRVNTVFTFMKFVMAAVFVLLVAGHAKGDAISTLQMSNPSGGSDFFANVSSVLMLALAGFSLLEASGCTSSETEDASRNVPRAVILSLLTVTAIYLGMCFCVSIASPFVLSPDKTTLLVPGTHFQATCPSLAGMLGGPVCGSLFTACVVSSIFGCAFGAVLSVARVSFSMAETKLFPEQFSRLDPVTRVPRYALWFQFWCITLIGVLANLLAYTRIVPDAYAFLGETFGFMYAFVAMLYGVCVVSLRYTDPHMKRPFRIGKTGNLQVWLMAIITFAIWAFAAICCTNWTHQLTGVAVLLAGVPIYLHYKKHNSAKDGSPQ
jgi:amino acid transporter